DRHGRVFGSVNLHYLLLMRRSFLRIVLASLAIAIGGCSAKTPITPSPPPSLTGTQTLTITTGGHVVATIRMPDGFIPVAGRPPMWLQNGTEVGVVGTIKDHITVIGLSGTDWHDQRVIAAEVGEGAEEQGSIIDLAPSPDGMTLAMTVAVPSEKRL